MRTAVAQQSGGHVIGQLYVDLGQIMLRRHRLWGCLEPLLLFWFIKCCAVKTLLLFYVTRIHMCPFSSTRNAFRGADSMAVAGL